MTKLNDSLDFSGKVAIVTGATGGNGRGITLGLAACGADLLLTDVQGTNLAALASELAGARGRVITAEADVSNLEEGAAVVDQALAEFGRIDFLVNNAGILGLYDVVDMKVENWDRTLGINLRGPVFMTQRAVRSMMERRSGGVVNIGSSLSANGGAGGEGVDYNISKAGLQCFTKTLATQLAPYGIRANSVSPGIIDTPMLRGHFPEEGVNAFAEAVPLARLGTPEDVANAVVFLLSDASSYITGQAIHVNGGLRMYDH